VPYNRRVFTRHLDLFVRALLCPIVLALVMALIPPAGASAQVRLADGSDRSAFRSWFALLADAQFDRPAPEVTDCAALVRFAFREALRVHTIEWARRAGLPFTPGFPDVRSAPIATAAGWPLFRVATDPHPRYSEFADAHTLVTLNARPIGRQTAALAAGDLLYFRQAAQSEPDHLMVFIGKSFFEADGDDWIVYHTGPIDGGPGEVRKVRLLDLVRHPSERWRPIPSNGRFVGAFRLAVL
jgi:uncharacterized protein YfaT (DUF1175 family)